MSNVKNISFEQIRNWVKVETEKGRSMREIIAKLATHQDVTVLSAKDSPEAIHRQIVDSLNRRATH